MHQFCASFGIFYCDMQNQDNRDQKEELLNARIKDSAPSSFNTYNENCAPICLNKEELVSLKSFSKKTTVQLYKNQIKRNNPLVIIDQVDYLQSILSDSSKFAEVFVADEKQLDILVNLENQIADLKKQLKDSQVNSDTDYKKAETYRFQI